MNNFLKQILEFLEKHSKFIRKLLIFTIIYFILCVVNNTDLLMWVENIFGEYFATAVQAIPPSVLVTSEV